MVAAVQIGKLSPKTRIQLVELIQGYARRIRGKRKIQLIADLDRLVFSHVRQILQADPVLLRIREQPGHRQKLRNIGPGFLWQIQRPKISWQACCHIALDSPTDRTFAAVIGRNGQQPVTKITMQFLEVLDGGLGRGIDVATAIIGMVALQPVIGSGGGNKLPDSGRLGGRHDIGLKGTFHDGKQGNFARHILLLHQLDDGIKERLRAILRTFEIGGMIGKPAQLAIDIRVIDGRQGIQGEQAVPQRVVHRPAGRLLLGRRR